MSFSLVTAPAAEPVSTADAKVYARVDHDDEDALFAALIKAARMWTEKHTRRALIHQTWDLKLPAFPPHDDFCLGYQGSAFRLPLAPVSSITSITYVDSAGATQTLAADQYALEPSTPALIAESYSGQWPQARGQADAVTVRFVAGYGSTSASVPEDITLAIKLLVNHWYETRVPVSGEAVNSVPFAVESLLSAYRWGYP